MKNILPCYSIYSKALSFQKNHIDKILYSIFHGSISHATLLHISCLYYLPSLFPRILQSVLLLFPVIIFFFGDLFGFSSSALGLLPASLLIFCLFISFVWVLLPPSLVLLHLPLSCRGPFGSSLSVALTPSLLPYLLISCSVSFFGLLPDLSLSLVLPSPLLPLFYVVLLPSLLLCLPISVPPFSCFGSFFLALYSYLFLCLLLSCVGSFFLLCILLFSFIFFFLALSLSFLLCTILSCFFSLFYALSPSFFL